MRVIDVLAFVKCSDRYVSNVGSAQAGTRSTTTATDRGPTSSTELAVRLCATTTAANQHLRAMRAGGLLVSARHGRSVLYRLSDLGKQFCLHNGGTR